MEKIYHVYAKGHCIYHSLKEEEFKVTWTALSRLAELVALKSDISYEELTVNKDVCLEASY
jgi:hypothetical protein